MATLITDECIRCGLCVAECPNTAISEGSVVYEIDPERCTECVGFHASEQCARPFARWTAAFWTRNGSRPNRLSFERARKLHPEREMSLVLSSGTSRFFGGDAKSKAGNDSE